MQNQQSLKKLSTKLLAQIRSQIPYVSGLALVTVLGLITACGTLEAKTTQQRYFALKQDYTTILTAADQYVTACRKAPTDDCKKRTKQIQDADNKVFPLFKAADEALVAKDDTRLEGYLNAASTVLSELEAFSK